MSVLGQALGQQREKKRNFFYPTIDARCVAPLLEHVPPGTVFAEPCAGAGDLIHLLTAAGLECAWGLELEPQDGPRDGGPRNRWPIAQGDAMQLTRADLHGAELLISNLPWHRPWLHPLIRHLAMLAPLWSLHDASWAYTAQAAPFLPLCTDIVAVGRLRWFEPLPRRLRRPDENEAAHAARMAKEAKGSDPPTDNAWYRFDANARDPSAAPRFHFRSAAVKDGRQGRLL